MSANITIAFTCPGCNKRYSVSDTYAGKSVHCKQCGSNFTAPCTPSLPTPNPYESPSVAQVPDAGSPPGSIRSDVTQDATGTPMALVVLIVLCCVHMLLNVAIFFLGTATGNVVAIFAGFVSFGFYVAILIGLVKKQEWARILTIWLSYVGIIASLFVFAPLEIPTLVCAHWPSVRRVTKGASMATTYTYHERSNDEGGPTE